MRIVAEQKLQMWGKKSLNYCTSGAGANDSEGVQSIGIKMGLQPGPNFIEPLNGKQIILLTIAEQFA